MFSSVVWVCWLCDFRSPFSLFWLLLPLLTDDDSESEVSLVGAARLFFLKSFVNCIADDDEAVGSVCGSPIGCYGLNGIFERDWVYFKMPNHTCGLLFSFSFSVLWQHYWKLIFWSGKQHHPLVCENVDFSCYPYFFWVRLFWCLAVFCFRIFFIELWRTSVFILG